MTPITCLSCECEPASSLRELVLSRTLCCDLCLADSFEAYRLFQYTGQLVTVLCETCALHVTHAAPSKRSSLMIRALLPRSAGNLLCKGRGVLRFLGCAKIGSFLEPAAGHFCVLPDVRLEGAAQKQNKNFSQLERPPGMTPIICLSCKCEPASSVREPVLSRTLCCDLCLADSSLLRSAVP